MKPSCLGFKKDKMASFSVIWSNLIKIIITVNIFIVLQIHTT